MRKENRKCIPVKSGRKLHESIVAKLLAVTIGIFIAMMLLSNVIIGIRQAQISDQFEMEVSESVLESASSDSLLLVISENQLKSLTEYRIFSGVVIVAVILLGGIVFTFATIRILQPLRELTARVNQIDMESVETARHEIAIRNGSYELRELSASFQSALNKIYENYEKQRQFSVNVAHELRTPLAVFQTRIDVFKRQEAALTPEVQSFVSTMENNVARLSELVEGILLLSRDLQPVLREVSVAEIAEEVIFDLEERAGARQVSLSVTGDSPRLLTDDALLERVLYNLTDNAIKYNVPGGSCEVHLTDHPQYVGIDVLDTGVGIGAEDRKHIFDLFYRADLSRNRETGGYGVGLALVRDIVQRLGGTIQVRDNTPRGTVFRLVFRRTGGSSGEGEIEE